MDLTTIILGLALRHGWTERPRLQRIADDITAAADSNPAFCGSAAVDATALLLTAVAEHESGFDPRVQSCAWRSGEPAISLFQLEPPVAWGGHKRAEICGSNALAAVLAARVLAHYRSCGSSLCMLRGYASGDSRIPSKAARELDAIFWTLLQREHLAVSYKNGCLTAWRTQ